MLHRARRVLTAAALTLTLTFAGCAVPNVKPERAVVSGLRDDVRQVKRATLDDGARDERWYTAVDYRQAVLTATGEGSSVTSLPIGW